MMVRAYSYRPKDRHSTGYLGDWELPALPERGEAVQGPDHRWFRVKERIFYANLGTVLLYVEASEEPHYPVTEVRSLKVT